MIVRTSILFVLVAGALSGQTATVRVQEGDLRLATTLGPLVGDQAAATLEAHAAELRDRGLRLRRPNRPLRVALVASIAQLDALDAGGGPGPERTRAISLAGDDANYIVMAWFAAGDPLVALRHELLHLHEPYPDAPLWLREGRAEYFARLGGGRDEPLQRMQNAGRVPLSELRTAERDSPVFASLSFYPTAWLVFDWLVERGGDPTLLGAEALDAAVEELGVEAVEQALTAHMLAVNERPTPAIAPRRSPPFPTAPAADWELDLILAAFDRERGALAASEARLLPLRERLPDDPRVAAELGALEMDRREYDRAEPLLRQATAAPGATARTRRRYALLLLRPADYEVIERAEEAARQANLALRERPDNAENRLTLAHAQMVAERWPEAERNLTLLLAEPDFAGRAESELATLRLRREQTLRAQAPAARRATAPPLVEAESEPPEPSAPPAAAKPTWPPPGVAIVTGQIDTVDCSGPEKIVILKSPLFPMRFREPKGQPARLYTPPQKWETIPCQGARGLLVNLAFRPAKELGRIRGDVVAILF